MNIYEEQRGWGVNKEGKKRALLGSPVNCCSLSMGSAKSTESALISPLLLPMGTLLRGALPLWLLAKGGRS